MEAKSSQNYLELLPLELKEEYLLVLEQGKEFQLPHKLLELADYGLGLEHILQQRLHTLLVVEEELILLELQADRMEQEELHHQDYIPHLLQLSTDSQLCFCISTL